MKKFIIITLGATFAFSLTHALATFSFHDGANIVGTGLVFEGEAGKISDTVGAFTLTAEALVDGVSAGTILNGTSKGFGINDTETGDDTERLDNINGIESMEFSFDIGGTFQSIDLRYITDASNEAVLSFAGGNAYQLNNTTALSGDDDFNIGETFAANQLITLAISSLASTGENFSLESFTVVPEPNTYALLTGMLTLVVAATRRRRLHE